MKTIKHLAFAGLIVLSGIVGTITTVQPTFAFDGSDCKKGSLYYDYYYKETVDKNGNPEKRTADEQKDLQEPKDSKDISTIADCNLPKTDHDLMDKANVIINVIVGVVGIVAVAVIVLGGVTFATSQGDTAKTTKAKNTILYGVIGLIVALLAFAIVNFVLKSVF